MTPESVKSNYGRTLRDRVVVRRYSGTGGSRTKLESTVRCRIEGYAPHELVNGVMQGDRRIIAYADDLTAGVVQAPIVRGDKVFVDGRELNVEAVDDSTRKIGSVLIAYILQVRG